MPEFLKHYGTTEGPLGLPMQDRQAFQLESILKALPPEDRALRHTVVAKAPTELLDGERADVSWISTEDIDRDREIVVSKGMNDAHFKLNPLVTLQHAYWRPPVGRSLWRKRVKDGPVVGIKAKTHYPPRPADWADDCWEPDAAFALVRAGLLQGKSIGFIALKSHVPTADEIAARPGLADVRRVIDEWLLLEYACVFLPANQAALVEAVSKGAVAVPDPVLRALGFDRPVSSAAIPFTPVEEIAKELRRRLERLDVTTLIEGRVQEVYHAARGRV
jgi:hypothetical protein